jgi:hypothetical protein
VPPWPVANGLPSIGRGRKSKFIIFNNHAPLQPASVPIRTASQRLIGGFCQNLTLTTVDQQDRLCEGFLLWSPAVGSSAARPIAGIALAQNSRKMIEQGANLVIGRDNHRADT